MPFKYVQLKKLNYSILYDSNQNHVLMPLSPADNLMEFKPVAYTAFVLYR